MRKKGLVIVVILLVLGGLGYLWYGPRPSADWYPSVGEQICPTNGTAVVTVVTASSTGSSSLTAYNADGEVVVGGQVEVVWRRAMRNPLTGALRYFGGPVSTDKDLYYGVYSPGGLRKVAASEAGAEALGQNYTAGAQVNFKELTGKSELGLTVVPLSGLTGKSTDRQKVAVGLMAADTNGQSVSCRAAGGAVEQHSYSNVLDMLEQAGGGGKILFTDAVLSGSISPVDSESFQYRIVRGGLINPDIVIPPAKGALGGSVELTPNVEVKMFTSSKTASPWWLAMKARPSGTFKAHVTGLSGYGDDWAQVTFNRAAAPGAATTGSTFKSINPFALQSLQGLGVSNGQIIKGIDSPNSSVSGDTHAAEPDSSYTASIDVRTEGLSDSALADLVHRLRMAGWAAFYRPHVGSEPHIHAIYAGVCTLKASTDGQVHSFLDGHNGLKGDPTETIYPPTDAEKQAVAQVYSSPVCAPEDRGSSTVVTTVGSASTLHPLVNMDGNYSGYFGAFYGEGYGDHALLFGHWDVTYDRNGLIPADAFLSGGSGTATVPITSAYPDPLPENCGDMCGSGSGLTATFGVYAAGSPWQDVYGHGYVPNGGHTNQKVGEFTYDYDHPTKPVTFQYHAGGATEAERQAGYKWGVAIVLEHNNRDNNYINDVAGMRQQFSNALELHGDSFSGYGGGYSGSGMGMGANIGSGIDWGNSGMGSPILNFSDTETAITNELGFSVSLPADDEVPEVTTENPPVVVVTAPDPVVTPEPVVTPQPVVAPAVTTPVPQPTVPAPSRVERAVAAITSLPDQIVALVSPEPQQPVIVDIADQTAALLANTKTQIATSVAQETELKKTLAQQRQAKDRAGIRTTQKALTAAKRATTAVRRSYTTQNRAYVAFIRARNALSAVRTKAGDAPNRTMKRKLVVAERTYLRAETSLKRSFKL